MNSLRVYWNSLSRRERLIVGLGGAAVIVIIGYVLVWEPWQRALQRLRVQVPTQIEALTWMQGEAARVAPLRTRRGDGAPSGMPVLTVIERSAREAQLRDAIRRIQPGRDNEVQVWLSNVAFDTWLRWIDALSRQGIDVVAANVDRAPDDTVNIRVTFQRS